MNKICVTLNEGQGQCNEHAMHDISVYARFDDLDLDTMS